MPSEWTGYTRREPAYADWLETVDRLFRAKFGLTLERLDSETLAAREFYERGISPDQYLSYVEWYLAVDALCVRFLSGCHLWAFDPEAYDAEDYFEEGWTPEGYFTDVLVTVLRNDYSDIDTIIADAAVWGSRRPSQGLRSKGDEECKW